VADTDPKSATVSGNAGTAAAIPDSAAGGHPHDGIPLPAHGFAIVDAVPEPDGATVSATEVLTRAAVLLISSAADRLGLAPEDEPTLDLAQARPLISALAALVAAADEDLGIHRESLQTAVRSLQRAFREASRYPDEPGKGPGEQYLS
jgi:Domain of unknown function (DUF1844)